MHSDSRWQKNWPNSPPIHRGSSTFDSRGSYRSTSTNITPAGAIGLHANVLINAVYYPNYRIYRDEKPSDLNYGLISHVFYAFAWVRENGEVHLSDEWADCQIPTDGHDGCLGSFMALKRLHPHLKILLSVGGSGDGSKHYPDVAADVIKRDAFALSCNALVQQYNLDGIDIDWEHPSSPRDGVHFYLLLQALRKYLPSPIYLLTTALPAGIWALQHINFFAAMQHLDYINLMAYDFVGPWSHSTGHQAQLFPPDYPNEQPGASSGNTAVTYLISTGVPSTKITLGIPAYGRSFLHANNIDQPNLGTGGEEGVFEYKSLPRPGSIEYVDSSTATAFCLGGDGGFVTYDNPKTVKLKAEYVKAKGLGGIFFWTGTADFPSGERSLVQASYMALHGEFQ